MNDRRSLNITWEDPTVVAKAAFSMKGIDFLQQIATGELPLPPIMALIDMRSAEASEGKAAFTCKPDERHYSAIGMVHGGIIAALLDTALGCAVHTTLPVGVGYATLELHVNYVRPITLETGIIRSEGEVLHVGHTVATAQARIVDAAGKLYAHATTTCMILRPTK